jgi:hypothetical protein
MSKSKKLYILDSPRIDTLYFLSKKSLKIILNKWLQGNRQVVTEYNMCNRPEKTQKMSLEQIYKEALNSESGDGAEIFFPTEYRDGKIYNSEHYGMVKVSIRKVYF